MTGPATSTGPGPGRRRSAWGIGASLVLATLVACGGGDAPSGAAGGATGRAVVAAVRASAAERAPWRCGPPPAGDPGPSTTVQIGAARWVRRGGQVRLERGHRRLGLIVDARADLPALTALATALRAAEVDAIISLGGLAATRAELVAAIDVLAGPALLVVVPGDLEAVADVRAVAVAAADRGVVDGRTVRWLEVGDLGLALLPGQPDAGRLAAGALGCGHEDADAAAVVAAWPEGQRLGARVLASQRSPRGDLLDVGQGDPGLALAVAGLDLRLTVGTTDGGDEGELPRTGRVERGDRGHVALPPASDDAWRGPPPRPPAQALIVEVVDGGGLAWRVIGAGAGAGAE